MIPVKKAKKPSTFDKKVREPGLRALAEMVGKAPPYPRAKGQAYKKIANRKKDIPSDKFPAYWTDALDELMAAYQSVCAYTCFRIHSVTGARSADHFVAKSKHWGKAYEWSNYRLCCSRINSRKNDFDDVLDPFLVGEAWFELELAFFQVIPAKHLAPDVRQTVQDSINRLKLNDFREARQEDAERYWQKGYSLDVLKQESPFVAFELHRQNRLNAGDAW